MKIYKWKKSDVDPVKLLYRVDAVIEKRAFPSYVFVSPKRYAEIRKFIYSESKKELKTTNKKRIAYSAELYLLNLGPVVLKGLPDEVVLVDDRAIELEGKQNEL